MISVYHIRDRNLLLSFFSFSFLLHVCLSSSHLFALGRVTQCIMYYCSLSYDGRKSVFFFFWSLGVASSTNFPRAFLEISAGSPDERINSSNAVFVFTKRHYEKTRLNCTQRNSFPVSGVNINMICNDIDYWANIFFPDRIYYISMQNTNSISPAVLSLEYKICEIPTLWYYDSFLLKC